ncbi:hypothetical protein DY000_02026560 [Brassica cretica]|uniref:Uncharacterized protein n=1 Tax=Brassica cretica TaxID=69181 RepID=A0ABQ7E4J0_BRACR|nr:hypothetical protein DY000_02026560 [Brassica cretica]
MPEFKGNEFYFFLQVVNKIDLPGAEPEQVLREIEEVIGLDCSKAILCSAKDTMMFSVVNAYVFSVHVLHCYLLAWYKNTRLNLFFSFLQAEDKLETETKSYISSVNRNKELSKYFITLQNKSFEAISIQ